MSVQIDLSGRCAVVTGAGKGIGRAICLELASAGAGLRTSFLPNNRGYFEIYWGYRLRGSGTNNPPYNVNGNLQDHGVHLQLVLQVL